MASLIIDEEKKRRGPERSFFINYACPIGERAMLCCGPMEYSLTGQDVIAFDGVTAVKPYLGVMFTEQNVPHMMTILTFEQEVAGRAFTQLTIERSGARVPWRLQSVACWDASSRQFREYLRQQCSEASIRKILYLLLQYVLHAPSAVSASIIRLIGDARAMLSGSGERPLQSFWLAPGLLFQEWEGLGAQTESCRLMINTPRMVHAAPVTSFPLGIRRGGRGEEISLAVTHLPPEVMEQSREAALSLLSGVKLRIVDAPLPLPEEGQNRFFAALTAYPETTQQRIREFIGRMLREPHIGLEPAQKSSLFANLQRYVAVSHTSVADVRHPFGMNIECALPLEQSVFIAGWLRDPQHQVESIEAVADLGFSLPLNAAQRTHFARPDVDALYENGPYGGVSGDWGFVAELPYEKSIARGIASWASPKRFRVAIALQGALHFSITPRPDDAPYIATRNVLLRQVLPYAAHAPAADRQVRGALLRLQRQFVVQCRVAGCEDFLAPPAQPDVSIIIPLYKNLDYLKTQMLLFAQDASLHRAEIIYVLDSPEQAETVRGLLADLSTLYDVPLRLVVMERNSGYACATRAGVESARAPMLLLLNSDVVPAQPGWLPAMLDYWRAARKPGAVGAKLLFEDGSIQHAGMRFARAKNRPGYSEIPYENRHEHKGYPADYAPAQRSRAVQAVTGACLLTSRACYDAVDGLTTDYIIGDYEDSDFCLKLAAKGYGSYYCAEAQLYHFERRSMSAHEHSDAAAYRYNVLLHHERWADAIGALLKKKGG